tara:strand:+ start:616 stop:1161 length:546 start_codon:yes stop_codon:yes gene_type:complete
MNNYSKLLELLEHSPNSKKIYDFIKQVQVDSFVDIKKQINHLKGVWELKWSSSKSPFLNYSPLLDNLQILDPDKSRGLNLLRPKGFLGRLCSTNILSRIEVIDHKRINVSFKKAGLLGPTLFGKKICFLSEIKKTQKGWLDTNVLTADLRICTGYKGTTFALLKRNDLSINEFFKPYSLNL